MGNRYLNIVLGTVIILVVMILILRPPSVINTYAEFHSSIWKISNQCIADYYYDDLTKDGIVMSFSSIRKDCEGEHLQDTTIKIYDEDETEVEAYKLHGLIIKLRGNANFMDKVILKRVDNDDLVKDITEEMREPNNEFPKDQDVPFLSNEQKI